MIREQTTDSSDGPAADLRRRAEEAWHVRGREMALPATAAAVERLVHELQVHQIELEMQNEELRHTQQEIEAARDKYFDHYDLAPVGYLTLSEQGIIQSANLTLAALLGVDRANLVNHPLTRFIVAEDQDLYYRQHRRLAQTGAPQVCELRLVRRGDVPFWAHFEAILKPDAAGGPSSCWATVTDISARKQAEALAASEAKYRTVADSAYDWVAWVAPDGAYLYVSPSCARITGHTAAEFLADANLMLKITHADDRPMLREHRRAVAHEAKDRTCEIEFRIVTPGGETRWISHTCTPIRDEEGQWVGRREHNHDSTERRQMQEELQRLAAIVACTHDAVISTDLDGKIASWNQGAERVYGYTATETIGHLLPALIAPNFLVDFMWSLETIRRGGTIERFETTGVTKDGRTLALAMTVSPIIGIAGQITGVASISQDITAHKLMAEAVSESEAKYRLLFENMEEGFSLQEIITDERGKVVDFRVIETNKAYDRHIGMKGQAIVGKTIREIMPEIDSREIEIFGKVALTGEPAIFGYTLETDGRQLRVQAFCPKHGQFATIFENITERRLQEQEIQRLNTTLEQQVTERTAQLAVAVTELKRAAKMKDEFMAAVSHELRTPLTGVLGLAEVLELQTGGPLNERQARYVQGIHQSGERLLVMVNSILRYTGLMAGNVILQHEPCRLVELCAIGVRAVRGRVDQKGQTIVFSVEPIELTIVSDVSGITLLLQQLLENAVKFTPAGGRIGLEVGRDGAADTVHLVVWDTGIGITPEQQTYIFQPFIQGDSSLARHFEGVGLGLAYVQRMVDLLGGTISLESVPGEGSRFTVVLPATPASEPRT